MVVIYRGQASVVVGTVDVVPVVVWDVNERRRKVEPRPPSACGKTALIIQPPNYRSWSKIPPKIEKKTRTKLCAVRYSIYNLLL
jgi:hypothetical protein